MFQGVTRTVASVTMSDTGADFTEPTAPASVLPTLYTKHDVILIAHTEITK